MTPFAKKWIVGDLTLKRLGTSLVSIYLFIALFALSCQSSLMFHPHSPRDRESADSVRIEVAPQRHIAGRFVENPSAKYTILLSHGNAEDVGDLREVIQHMVDSGFSVFAYDYEGYGYSLRIPPKMITHSSNVITRSTAT